MLSAQAEPESGFLTPSQGQARGGIPGNSALGQQGKVDPGGLLASHLASVKLQAHSAMCPLLRHIGLKECCDFQTRQKLDAS